MSKVPTKMEMYVCVCGGGVSVGERGTDLDEI